MTHQLITALQQKASAVLTSANVWKNIVERKKIFEKQLEDKDSLASDLLDLYHRTNQELRQLKYQLPIVNQKLQQSWFVENYPHLQALSEDEFNQLRFDFSCYQFQFIIDQWRVYNPHTGMILFVPVGLHYKINPYYQIDDMHENFKVSDKKSNVVQSLDKLLMGHDRWVIYLTGHGHPKNGKQAAYIAGLKAEDFKKLLEYFNNVMNIRLVVYSSCFGGGVHTVEPYENLQLTYPIIVTALTDAPIFGFGLFEGVKLPPYDDQFKLEVPDVLKNEGLQPCALQNYTMFFKRAWKGLFDLHLIQYVSKFFACDFLACHVQKVENFPLIRKTGSTVFTPLKDGTLFKLVQQITTNSVISLSKPLLLYTKKVKKIKMDQALSIISMLPGIASHEIGELYAPTVCLSSLLTQSFLSLEDRQAYKNFMIKKLVCRNDLLPGQENEIVSNVLIMHQKNLMPKFVDKNVQALLYVQSQQEHHLFTWQDQKIVDHLLLNSAQVHIIQEIADFVQASVNYKAGESFKLLTFEAYQENKKYQQELVDTCVKVKVCKKN
jgi:hypothetical protein